MGKVFVFIAIEIILLVTPMMWPTIPFELGLVAYGIAAIFAILAIGLQMKDSIWGPSRHTQVMRARRPSEIAYRQVMRDGRLYDRALVEIVNPAPNLAAEEVRVRLVSIEIARGRKIKINKFLRFDESDLDATSIATDDSRNIILFESERRLNKQSEKVADPRILFGPLVGRKRFLEMPTGRYIATIQIEGHRIKPTNFEFEVLLNRHNRLWFRPSRRKILAT